MQKCAFVVLGWQLGSLRANMDVGEKWAGWAYFSDGLRLRIRETQDLCLLMALALMSHDESVRFALEELTPTTDQ